jgi:hypothetical protein
MLKVLDKIRIILSNLLVNGNTLVSDLLDDFGKEIKIDVSKYKQIFAENLVTSVKDLIDASDDSWRVWNLPTKLNDWFRIKIKIDEKGILSYPILSYPILSYANNCREKDNRGKNFG